ncbi:DUF1178 family protein [Sphingomonas sp.]|uniref:DUF1178 family protein n=1 Tax=Sphingomonas sp. TaxID=28214 RepID=UPI003B3AA7F1
MIVYDIACPAGHVFEAWFGSSADFEDQRERGLLTCPVCGAGEVSKAVMAPAVAPKGNSRDDRPVPMRGGPPAPAEMKAMLAALARAQAKALEGSEDVGRRFADEARAMHEGDADERRIHGQATVEEAKALVEDGVPVMPLPLPIVPPGTTH